MSKRTMKWLSVISIYVAGVSYIALGIINHSMTLLVIGMLSATTSVWRSFEKI